MIYSQNKLTCPSAARQKLSPHLGLYVKCMTKTCPMGSKWGKKIHGICQLSQIFCPNFVSLRIQICPEKGISPVILLWGWDWDHQTYSREGYGSLGYINRNKDNPWYDPWYNFQLLHHGFSQVMQVLLLQIVQDFSLKIKKWDNPAIVATPMHVKICVYVYTCIVKMYVDTQTYLLSIFRANKIQKYIGLTFVPVNTPRDPECKMIVWVLGQELKDSLHLIAQSIGPHQTITTCESIPGKSCLDTCSHSF